MLSQCRGNHKYNSIAISASQIAAIMGEENRNDNNNNNETLYGWLVVGGWMDGWMANVGE